MNRVTRVGVCASVAMGVVAGCGANSGESGPSVAPQNVNPNYCKVDFSVGDTLSKQMGVASLAGVVHFNGVDYQRPLVADQNGEAAIALATKPLDENGEQKITKLIPLNEASVALRGTTERVNDACVLPQKLGSLIRLDYIQGVTLTGTVKRGRNLRFSFDNTYMDQPGSAATDVDADKHGAIEFPLLGSASSLNYHQVAKGFLEPK